MTPCSLQTCNLPTYNQNQYLDRWRFGIIGSFRAGERPHVGIRNARATAAYGQ